MGTWVNGSTRIPLLNRKQYWGFGNTSDISSKRKKIIKLPHDPTTSLLSIYPENKSLQSHKNLCTKVCNTIIHSRRREKGVGKKQETERTETKMCTTMRPLKKLGHYAMEGPPSDRDKQVIDTRNTLKLFRVSPEFKNSVPERTLLSLIGTAWKFAPSRKRLLK